MRTRRRMLADSAKVAGWLASAGLLPSLVRAESGAYAAPAFEAKSLPELMKVLGANAPVESADVTLTGPEIAENGAVVPLIALTTLPGVKRLLILVEKNPAVLSAMFDVTEAIEPSFSTRVKMGQSSAVYAVAMMGDGKLLYAKREIKVTLGGCGG